MIEIIPASISDTLMIKEIAYDTWPETYKDILSNEQMIFMLEKMYSEEALKNQMSYQSFFLLQEFGKIQGFMSIEHNDRFTKIHKLYILPGNQGKGFGKMFIEKAATESIIKGINQLSLNVNRNNKAINFYQKMGFQIEKSEDIDIGNGYLMEDYVMVKKLG